MAPIQRRKLVKILAAIPAGIPGCSGILHRDNDVSPTAAESPEEFSGSWPMFKYDISNTGHNPDSVAPSRIKTMWSVKLGNRISTSPVLIDGRIYIGSYDKRLYSLKASNGSERWRFDVGTTFSTPAVVDGTVYTGSFEAKKLFAIDARDGSEKWSVSLNGGVVSSPVVHDDLVYITTMQGNGGKIYAFDSTTGKRVWEFRAGASIPTSPAVRNGRIFVGSLDNKMYALDAHSGENRWVFTAGSSIASSPAVRHETVYFGSFDTKLYAVSIHDGSKYWEFPTGAPISTSPSIANGHIYVGSRDFNLYALSTNGKKTWSYRVGLQFSSPVVADGQVHVGTMGRRLIAIDSQSGTARWIFNGQNDIKYAPSVVSGRVFFGTWTGHLYGLAQRE